MISHLSGKIIGLTEGHATVDVSGVGYKVSATGQTLASLKEGADVSFWTHLAVRENALDLYGFGSEDELRFFELLITISGI
jgi:Holliday junction DNA helicase RuvA